MSVGCRCYVVVCPNAPTNFDWSLLFQKRKKAKTRCIRVKGPPLSLSLSLSLSFPFFLSLYFSSKSERSHWTVGEPQQWSVAIGHECQEFEVDPPKV